MNCVNEKRSVQRFDLELPCLIQVDGTSGPSTLGMTKDVSSAGVYLITASQVRVGHRVEVDLLVNPGNDSAHQSHLQAAGVVIRQDTEGLAVAYEGAYRLRPLNGVVEQLRKRLEWLERQRRTLGLSPVNLFGIV